MVQKLITEFSGKGWTVSGLNKLLRKLRNTGSRSWKRHGSGLAVGTDDNVDSVSRQFRVRKVHQES